jgi:hypothetical protein
MLTTSSAVGSTSSTRASGTTVTPDPSSPAGRRRTQITLIPNGWSNSTSRRPIAP